MANTRKSIIDEAFMEAENIDNAFKANAKEILAQTMSSEIEEMVKESLEDSFGLNEDEDEEVELGSNLAGLDAGDEEDFDLIDFDDEDEDEDFDLSGLEDEDEEDVEINDLTDETNMAKVIDVFKKMSPEDEIEVVQDGNNIDIKDNETGAEYRIELGGGMDDTEEDDTEGLDIDFDLEDEDEDEEYMSSEMGEGVIYEVVLEDEEELDEEEEELDEAPRTNNSVTSNRTGNRKGSDRNYNRMNVRNQNESTRPSTVKLVNENKVLKTTIDSIKSENESLKEDYNKMVDALKQFREKLNEVAIFNSNLTYTVRLFTEHSTTKDEKVDIIKRFDEAKTLKESKNIYKNLVKEISKTKAPIKESIDNKLNETKSSGSATQITESKVYVNPEFEKMKQLWSYDYKK